MEYLAPRHLETRFVKIDAEKSPFLCERFNIFMMPTIVVVKSNEKVHMFQGFDELGGVEDFPPNKLAYEAAKYAVIDFEGKDPMAERASVDRKLGERVGRSIRDGAHEADDDYGESDAELDDMMAGFDGDL